MELSSATLSSDFSPAAMYFGSKTIFFSADKDLYGISATTKFASVAGTLPSNLSNFDRLFV